MKTLGSILLAIGILFLPATVITLRPFSPIPAWLFPVIGGIVMLMGAVLLNGGQAEDFRPDAKLVKTENDYPCPVCRSQDFTWGHANSPQPSRFRTTIVGLIGTGQPILARMCNKCGHVALFVKQKRP